MISVQQTSKRYIEYDMIRILACFCVIMIHCAVFDQGTIWEYTSFRFQAINIWGVLSRWAVPAFVMLSGMLTMPKADKTSIAHLFFYRVIRMLVVYFAWSCVYSFYNTFVLEIVYAPTKLKTFIDGCFSGELHMWYLPMLAGLYMISPLLAVLVKKLERKWIIYWLSGLFVFSSIIPFIIKLNIKFVSAIVASVNGYMNIQFLCGWTLYYVLGYYIQQHSISQKEKIIVYIGAIIAFIFTMWGTVIYYLKHGEALGILPYEYPNIVLFSVGIMVFFKEHVSKLKISNNLQKFVTKVSSLTLGIYLLHVLLLKVLYFIGINIQLFHPILSIPVVSAIVFVIGAIIVWFLKKIPFVGKYLV